MPDDAIQTGHRKPTKWDEDAPVEFNSVGKNVTHSRPVVVDPPICDEQEWHRF